MAEILNLDDLNNVLKQFKFQGSVYDICEISLGDFIALTAEQKTMEAKSKAGGITEAELVESYRRNVMRMIPTITADVLDKMTMRQVKTLLDFINAAALEEQLDEDQAKKVKRAGQEDDGEPGIEAIDLGFFISRVMRFYSMSHPGVLGLPLKTFWMLDRNISRVHAEEDRRQLRLLLVAQSSDADAVKGLIADLESEIGQPLRHAAEMDKGAIDRLKALGSFR